VHARSTSGRLPARYRPWVLHDLTCRTWPLRHLAVLLAQLAPVAMVLVDGGTSARSESAGRVAGGGPDVAYEDIGGLPPGTKDEAGPQAW
jgi:uncharacterized protein DUF5313